MAIKLPTYNQQTSTPGNRMQGGDPRTAGVDYSLAEGINKLAQGVGVMARQRQDANDSAAAADASKKLADAQLAAVERSIEIRRNAGPGGAGVLDAITAEMNAKRDEVLATITNETARKYFTQQWTGFDLNQRIGAVEYEAVERERQTTTNFQGSIKSASSLAAVSPADAAAQYAQVVAPIKADRNISEQTRTALIEAAGEDISYAAASSAVENDPYAALRSLNIRFGLAADATAEQAALHMDSAAAALEETERVAGVTVPAAQREEAIAAFAAGGGFGVRADGSIQITRGDQSGVPTEAGFAFDMLSVPRALELRARALGKIADLERDRDQEMNGARVMAKYDLNNRLAAWESGQTDVPAPTYAEIEFVVGPDEAPVVSRKFAIARENAPVLASLPNMTTQELVEITSTPPKGATDFGPRRQAWEQAATQAQAHIDARKNDSGGYVLSTSPTVKRAYEMYETAQAEAQNDPEMAEVAIKAQTTYLQQSIAEQQRIGIAVPMLPKQYVASAAANFTAGINTDNPEVAARQLQFAFDALANFPAQQAQLLEGVGGLGELAASEVPGTTIKRLAELNKVKADDLTNTLQAHGLEKRQIADAVSEVFAPLTFSLGAAPSGTDPSAKYRTNGELLAIEAIQSGRAGGDPRKAAQMAYQELFGERHIIVDRLRIPTNKAYTPDAVVGGLRTFLQTEAKDRIGLIVEGGIMADETLAASVRTIQRNGEWITDGAGDGAYLYSAGVPVMDRTGKQDADGRYIEPIHVKFTDAAAMRQTRAMPEDMLDPLDPKLRGTQGLR